MNNLNSVLVEGNLVRDPELSYESRLTTGSAVCKFSISSIRTFKTDGESHEEVSFFDVVAHHRMAETCAEYLKKGRGVRIVGRLWQDRWSYPDGEQHSQVLIVAEHVEFRPRPSVEEKVENDDDPAEDR